MMERMCDLKSCEDYRGFDVGYCHKLKTIMNSHEKKMFFADNCTAEAEAVKRAWEVNMLAAWDPES